MAKSLSGPCSPEHFGDQLARHFTSTYEKVSECYDLHIAFDSNLHGHKKMKMEWCGGCTAPGD